MFAQYVWHLELRFWRYELTISFWEMRLTQEEYLKRYGKTFSELYEQYGREKNPLTLEESYEQGGTGRRIV
jgi:hypothetical protein